MEKKMKKTGILTGTILTGALLALTSNADARPAISKVLGNGAELRSEIIDLNINSSAANVYELKCGAEGEVTKKAKPVEAKPLEAKDKSTEAKCGEGKCGEGKCGGSDDTKNAKISKDKDKDDVKAVEAKKEEKKDKAAEAKCGEGKCGTPAN